MGIVYTLIRSLLLQSHYSIQESGYDTYCCCKRCHHWGVPIQGMRAVDIYLKTKPEDRKPCMFVLDSLGMLSTEKEISDDRQTSPRHDKISTYKGHSDATLKLANIPMIVTNHTYDVIDYVPTKEAERASRRASRSFILAQKKEGTEGLKTSAKTHKSRWKEKEGYYYDERGLDKYYGLLELERWSLENVAGRYEMDKKSQTNLERTWDIFHSRGNGETRPNLKREFSHGENWVFILKNLLHNEEYLRKVIPSSSQNNKITNQRIVFEEIQSCRSVQWCPQRRSWLSRLRREKISTRRHLKNSHRSSVIWIMNL